MLDFSEESHRRRGKKKSSGVSRSGYKRVNKTVNIKSIIRVNNKSQEIEQRGSEQAEIF